MVRQGVVRPKHLPMRECEQVRVITDLVTIKARAKDTGGAYSLFETETPPAGGCPPHTQRYDDETLFVIEGRYAVLVGEEQVELGPGGTACIPRGTAHAFTNVGSEPARMLVLVTPGGIKEQFLDEVGDRADRPAWEPDMAKVLAVAPKYGIEFLLPPGTVARTRPGAWQHTTNYMKEKLMVITELEQVRHSVAVTSDPFEALRSRLAGELLTIGSAAYDEARRTVSIKVDPFPLAIVRAANAQDVAATVDFARDHALPLAVRSGGHSLANLSVVDGAVVVDLSGMKRISIDPEARVARVQPGATSGDLAGPAHAHGLALSTGDTHSVGMGGLTTGGGIGYLVRKYGLAIDNLLSAQVVTAGGEILTASASEHPDLFWAIRGGGGNFGIITEFTFQLASVGEILGGALILPASREVIRGYLEHSASAPDDLTTIGNLMFAPPAPFIPQERVGEPVLMILLAWTGGVDDGERALAPLRALATPVADTVGPIPYPEIYRYMDFASEPHAASIRMMFADDLSDDAIDAVLAAMNVATSPYAIIQIRGLGGAYGRIANDATAFAHRDRRYFVAIINVWLDAAETAATHEAWTASLWQAIRHEGSGVYVNFLEIEGANRVREAYPGGTFERLQHVKAKYDPANLFRFNQNVPPRL